MSTMSVRSAAVWAIASQYTSFAVQFVTSVVLARWFITPGQLGLFTIAFAAVTLVAFLQDFGVTRYVNGERDLTPEKLGTAFTVSVLFAWGVALAAILAAGPIARFYGDPALLPVTRIIAASYLLVPLAIVPQALCQRRLDYRSNTMIEVGSSLANAAVTMTLAMRGMGALALAWGAFAQQAARLAVSQWRGGPMLPWPFRLSGARPVIEIGGTNSVLSVSGSIVARAPELVVGRIIDQEAVGLYTRAAGLALQLRLLVAGAVTGVFYPAFRQLRDRGDPLGPAYLRVTAAYTGITWPAMAGIAVLAWPLIDLLYGERWLAAAPLLAWVALAQICYIAVPLNGDLPILLGRKRALVNLSLLETALAIALLVLAAPFGLAWVAIARLFHGLCFIALYAPLMRKLLDLRWKSLLAVYFRSAGATLAAVTPLLASFLAWQPPEQASLIQLGSGVVGGVILWLVALRLLRHPLHDEIAAVLEEILPRLPVGRMVRKIRPATWR